MGEDIVKFRAFWKHNFSPALSKTEASLPKKYGSATSITQKEPNPNSAVYPEGFDLFCIGFLRYHRFQD